MFKCPAKGIVSLISMLAMLLAVAALPSSGCSPGDKINACCASDECSTAMDGTSCCNPNGKKIAFTEDFLTVPLAKSISNWSPAAPPKTSQSLNPSFNSVREADARLIVANAFFAKPARLYLLNRSLLI